MSSKKTAKHNLLILISLVSFLITTSGCASIVSGQHQSIAIHSNPSEAAVRVYDTSGQIVTNSKTPFTVTLKKGRGYFKGADYKVVIEKPGYRSSELRISSRLGGWYAFGNLLFGGLIGYLIVDPITGSMWVLTPDKIDTTLGSGTAFKNTEGLTIVLKENVPEEFLNKMELIH